MISGRRYDFAEKILSVTCTPTGGRRVKANMSRVGVFAYTYEDGSVVREYRPPEEVLSPATLASFVGASVTDLHPTEMVTPSNWGMLSKGIVISTGADGEFMASDSIDVNDAEGIRKLDSGEWKEGSCGYTADFDPTPGVSPQGEPYDGVQRNIRGNHFGFGPEGWGRMGPSVGLRADGAKKHLNACPGSAIRLDMAEPVIRKHKIGNLVLDAGSDAHIAVVDEKLGELGAKLQTAQNDLATATARADKAERAADPATIAKRVAERVNLIAQARRAKAKRADSIEDLSERASAKKAAWKYLDDAAEQAGTSDDAIIAEIVKSLIPGFDPSGMSHEALMGALRAAAAGSASDEAAEGEDMPPPVDGGEDMPGTPPAAAPGMPPKATDGKGLPRGNFDATKRRDGDAKRFDGADDERAQREAKARDKRANLWKGKRA